MFLRLIFAVNIISATTDLANVKDGETAKTLKMWVHNLLFFISFFFFFLHLCIHCFLGPLVSNFLSLLFFFSSLTCLYFGSLLVEYVCVGYRRVGLLGCWKSGLKNYGSGGVEEDKLKKNPHLTEAKQAGHLVS